MKLSSMINDIIISRLDELIGDFDTPFFNYLLYSYDLSLNDCEIIVSDLKRDIKDNNVSSQNLVSTLEDYFKSWVADGEKKEKIEYLSGLIDEKSEFFNKFLKHYNLKDSEIEIIFEKIKSKILKDNINDFEIKRDLEYYFSNTVKQELYLRDLDNIVGRNYDTLIIKNAFRKYPVLRRKDIFSIVINIHEDIIEAKPFPNGIKHEFKMQCMKKSELKKAEARLRLNDIVEGKGDSFAKLTDFKNLKKTDADIIVSQITEEINAGLIQPESVNNVFITKRFNEYIENEK